MHHVLANKRLHLHGIEVLLVVHHVTNGLLVHLHLLKLDEQHVVQLVKVLAHVVDSYAAGQLEEHSLDAAIEFALHLADLAIVLLVGLRVLVEPVLAVLDRLVHALLEILVALLLTLHLRLGVGDLLGHVSLGAQHHILHLLQILLVLVELLLKGHRGVNFLLKIDLRLVDLLLSLVKLLSIVRVDRLKFLVLDSKWHG